jgi:CheY-like chemotaxis protein
LSACCSRSRKTFGGCLAFDGANRAREDPKACLDSGMDAYLSKPIDREQLMLLLNASAA